MNSNWMIAGLGGTNGPAILFAQLADLDVTYDTPRVSVASMGSLAPCYIPLTSTPDIRVTARGVAVQHIAGATFTECLRSLAAVWSPDQAEAHTKGDGLQVRRRSGF